MTADLRILLLEDEESQAVLVARAFGADPEFSNCELLTVEGLAAARAAIAAREPDVVLADYNLADGTALDFLAGLAAPIPFPVVVLTAQGDEEKAVGVIKAGALDYVTKSPETFRALPQIVRRIRREWEQRVERRRAEAALRESESRLQDFLDSASDLIQSVAGDGRFIFTNKAWQETMGYSARELADMTIFEVIASECGAHCQDTFARLMQGENVGLVEITFLAKDGHPVQVEGHVNVRFDEAGKPLNTRGIFRDVTAKRHAEAALAAEQQRAQRYLDTVQTLMVSLDRDGRIAMINRKGCEVLGLSEAELLGRSWIDEFVPAGADRAEIWSVFQRLVAGVDLPAEGPQDRYYENEVICADGQPRVFAWHNSVLRDVDGNITGTLSSGEDITDRRIAEDRLRRFNEQLEQMVTERSAALKESEQRFRTIFANSVDGILVIRDGLVQMANPAFGFMLGETAGDTEPQLKGQAVTGFTAPEHRAVLQQGLDDLARGELVEARHELPLLRRDGGELLVELRASSFRLGDEVCVLVVCRDMTERRESERRLLRSQRMESIGTLAGGVAHDLNNTLSPILMSAEMLKLDLPEVEPETAELVDFIENSAKRGANMVKQLLTFAKGAGGERVDINVRPLLKEIEQFVFSTFDKSIRLVTDHPTDPTIINGDATQIHQILLNLCVNARDAMADGGTLRLGARNVIVNEALARSVPDGKTGLHLCLYVEDSGTGMTPEVLERVFDPFFTTKGPDKGTGLGLSTVLGIVRGHRGFMRIDSEIGRGTRFEVYLPSAEQSPVATGIAEERVVAPGGPGRTVLVVEDEMAIRRLLAKMLGRMGYEVLTAANGLVAMVMLAEHARRIDLMITDINMPSMDGITLIKRLRSESVSLPVVVMTGVMDGDKVAELEALDLSGTLPKPFNQKSLAAVLAKING